MRLILIRNQFYLNVLDTGVVEIYSPHGQRYQVDGFSKGELMDGESFTFNLLTTLSYDPPIIYDFIPGSSQGDNYANFFINYGSHFLANGSSNFVDNCSFHVYTWS